MGGSVALHPSEVFSGRSAIQTTMPGKDPAILGFTVLKGFWHCPWKLWHQLVAGCSLRTHRQRAGT